MVKTIVKHVVQMWLNSVISINSYMKLLELSKSGQNWLKSLTLLKPKSLFLDLLRCSMQRKKLQQRSSPYLRAFLAF